MSGNSENMDLFDEDELLIFSFFMILQQFYTICVQSQRRWWVRPIFQERNEKGAFRSLFNYMKINDHEMFFKYRRMFPEHFDLILNLVKRHLSKRSRREYLSPELRLAMTLKYLAHGGSFQNLSWEFRVGHSTVSKVIFETCEAIWNVLKPIYVKSHDKIDWLQVSNHFLQKWNFPHTLGAIDGKHVQIQCPINSGSQYYNYKNHFSMVLLACCDADYKFLWVDIGGLGSEHDSGVFRRSQMGQDLENGTVKLPNSENLHGSNIEMPFFFVADEAFPLKPYIMRPYPGKNLEEKKLVFNYRLSRARRTIENSFGILASRWRVYRSPLLCSIKTTEAIVKATVCLHNYLRTEASQTYTPPALLDTILEDGELVEGEWREITKNDTNLTPAGRMGSNMAANAVTRLRDSFANYLISDVGSVPWQQKYINRGRI